MTESHAELDVEEIRAMMEALAMGAAVQMGDGPPISTIIDQHRKAIAQLRKLDPFESALAFGSLLTVPELQGNCLRLETLVRLSLLVGNGKSKPSDGIIRTTFQALGDGICGSMEDPTEDVFVGTVRTPRGNFRVFEGMWEGNAFYLQRLLNVVEAMPTGSGYDELRGNIYALLTMSDLVCERARVERHQLGAEGPLDRLNVKAIGSLATKSRRIRFSVGELQAAGISPLMLAPFLFNAAERSQLSEERMNGSALEKRPLLRRGDQVALALPTAVSAAIRHHVISRMTDAGMLTALQNGVAKEYAAHFSNTPVLGGRIGAPIKFEFTKFGGISAIVSQVDEGRYLNQIFITDQLRDLEETGVGGMNPDAQDLSDLIDMYIAQSHEVVSARPGFVDGMSLIINCGIGRGSAIMFGSGDLPNWRVEYASAYDVDTLSWVQGFKPLSLWRLLDAQEKVGTLGAALHNFNGIINMVGWTRSLGGHIVPHANLPADFTGGFLAIDQTSQRLLRHEVMTTGDPRVIQDVEGRWIPARRDQQSDFADDQAAPLYGSEIPNDEGWLMSAYLAPRRTWWAEASMPDSTTGALGYERWRMMTVWLSRAAPILDALPLPAGPVKWRGVFPRVSGGLHKPSGKLAYAEARAAISVSVDAATNTVITTVSAAFEDALYHPENIAERALVDAMIEGFLILASQPQQGRPSLLHSIMPNPLARQAHAFAAQKFRDFVHSSIPDRVVKIDKDDDAIIRLDLGWQVRSRSAGGQLTGKAETTSYLNALVKSVEEELCTDLRAFDREKLLARLLLNHEAAAADRDRWSRTSAAVLALHADRQSTLSTMAEHDFALNATFQASRVLMEIGICEAPISDGRTPGDLDLSRAMAKALLLFYVGGWSDAIRWDVMEPTVQITALGDVHAKFGYVDTIITPHAKETSDVRINDAASNYADNLKQPEGRASIADVISPAFLEAWEEEFGSTLDQMRVFIDWLENRGIERDEALMRMSRADFSNINAEGQMLDQDVVAALLERLTLVGRTSWREIPDGFDDRDRQPWRYRRRLSPMRRPIMQVGAGDDAVFLVAPGMVRDVFAYMVANYVRGDFPPHQLSKKMRAWAAREADSRGAKFTQEVAEQLREQGWEVQTEIKISKILQRKLDRDYGDVDVLAWHARTNRVLVIECKDVQFKKTFGEISEQLADFRGEIRPNGKPDYLLRHLDRMGVLLGDAGAIAAYLNLPTTSELNLESHLVFRNPVPMKFALAKLSERVRVSIFEELSAWPALDCRTAEGPDNA
jgi:hypothetical protein